MLATFVIFIREGIEASMIVAILLTHLDRIGQRRHFRDVFAGVAAAMAAVLVAGVVVYETVHTYAGTRGQTIFETATYLLAAAILTYMTFWMRRHARDLSGELRRRTTEALDRRARFGLAVLAFQAVGREGLETMVFTLAIVFATSGRGAAAGGAAGLVVALGFAFVVYRLGRRLNIAVWFKVLGVLLIVFAAGLLADAVENLQQLGWVPELARPLWDTGRVLSEDSAFGDVVHSFFGYAQAPTALQVGVWATYVVVTVGAFVGLGRAGRRSRRERPVATSGA
jgi:high-affinity iron transporter